ncbi:DNA topoisomerase [Fusarium oxysporum Fo47]|nr:DNA topoisomerase [Fusarium oxysporum Fo47]QKD52773.1 DNA topoisomerase [Fusarium oxysporum Fo47]RKK18792.1 DNA topoisomerase 2 [Fusarium oxysporum f. sp. cepae]RKK53044.1 DNA topoisomerase 2 [Fusarium oxysporum f. sp. cepae]RKK54015.1 DNA topoisomerase 2 [Fusarium oxysporum f. sp. cepae]
MDSDASMFSLGEESDGYVPETKAKPKAAPKKAAARPPVKKMVQTTLKTKSAPRKRPTPESDDDDISIASGFSNTPPKAKKQKKEPAVSKSSGAPLEELENDSMVIDSPAKPGKKKTATEMYTKLSQLEHILKRPDTYIGSVERTEQQMWVLNKESQLMEYKNVSFVPGLYKIFDEILVNAADNKQRDGSMTYMKINIDRENGVISVENNGKGIPIVIHEKEKIYIPELIFGHLLAGSNFDDDEKKTVGGRNGYGAKLCNVFSTEFNLECQDSEHGKRYKQTWRNNMQTMEKAKITSSKTSDFTRVTFKPDFKRFGMEDGIDDDLESLLHRRVYDMVGTIRGIKVFLNGEQIKIKDFKAYCDLYAKSIAKERSTEEGGAPTCTVEMDKDKSHPRWEVGFAVSDGTFQQVSFVNSIATTSGGTHVNYIADQVTEALLKALNKKRKGHALKQSHLKNHIFIFVNCYINNPAFTSQTKEQMTTKPSQFGSKCKLGEDFLKKIAKSDALQNILDFAEKKADKMLAKGDGNKRSRVNNAKLVEANFAGTRRGHECTLILTEGDSAKGLAVSGRAILDPDRIGVFPLRGKLLNVRDASVDQIMKNAEIQNIKQFLGLKHKQTYTDTKNLRYGHLMIMADQDHDGSHIKGLLINFLQVQFPSLLKIPDFFREFITPIVKVWQGPNPKKPQRLKSFFTQPEYEEWKEDHKNELTRWHSKYFKGLGTSSNEDAQVYFTNLDDHLKEFDTMKPEEADLLELAFSKKKADARKEWLGNFVPGTYLDHSTKSITYSDFINRELILFSMADNMRSIPSVLDGFKPGQRKVIYACFKRNLVKDKKVVELAGYVSEQTAYHHGEQSLQQTIIGLAQNFVGSNNINCLEPSGNFGSRLAGGSDAASPRYTFTRLSPFARKIFHPMDEPNLMHHYEDGKKIEPMVYAPIIPMVLVNGADGIGTGWSTSIPNYHPMDIVKNLKRRMGRLDDNDLEERPFETMMPWFRGWKGTPEVAGPDRYKFNGIAYHNEQKDNEVVITELPIRMWTDDFKGKLEKIIAGVDGPAWIKDYKEFNDHSTVHFEIAVDDKHMGKVLEEGVLERFKLTKQVATSNLVAFDTRGMIRKYEKVEDILEEFYLYRLDMYTDRKKHWLGVFHADYRKLKNQARFIKEIIDGQLVVGKKKKTVLVQELRDCDYEAFPPGGEKKKTADEEDDDADENQDVDGDLEGGARDYDYLLSMPIWSLTAERLEKLKQAIEKKKAEHDELLALSEKDLWCRDLDDFMAEWETQLAVDAEIKTSIRRLGRRVSKKIGAGTARGRKVKDDDEYEPDKKGRGRPKAAASKATVKTAPKVETKSAQRFAEMFSSKPKVKKEPSADVMELSDLSDDDYAALSRSKSSAPAIKTSQSPPTEAPENPRVKRAAASKVKTIIDDDSESDDDQMLGDVGALVKGIDKPAGDRERGRFSLHAMSRPDSSQGNASVSGLSKSRPKSAKAFDFDDDSPDDTNYELLAKSSPHKTATKDDHIDSFLSDDEPFVAPSKSAATKSKPTSTDSEDPTPAGLATVKKGRGRPAGAKSKEPAKPKAAPKATKTAASKVASRPATKQTTLSPAAKAYAAKKAVKKSVLDDDSDEDMADPDSPPPKASSRVRPGRAAASRRPIVVDDDSSVMQQDDESDDPFEVDDDED